ncbi:hypothetical protein NOR_07086 [Metarhizium rileyi]|uniref:Protein kinase-like domain protein n=1 Tax=Metarhizium rileyi (strain RCEF 4871) TaxID=1649241 RepID=A0A166YZK2_METRR|nr:hypothetical protein NOR_07086 [Metarhizium rileyi RCEF 4871]
MQQDVISVAGHRYRISAGGRNDSERRRWRRFSEIKEEQALQLMRWPFLNEESIDSPLACSKREFKQPRLRKCSFELDSIHFVERVGGGLDGYNWKIQVPKGGPTYVLKLFWDTEPWYPHYFSAQRECQNAALFQHIEAAVLDAAGPGNKKGPILLNPEPESKQDALANLLAFSNEARQHNMGKQSHNLLSIDEIGKIPRVRQCHGWLKVTGKELRDHWVRSSCREFEPPPILVDKVVRSIDNAEVYTAVVYEFIEETHNDHDVVHSVLDFFWRAGFSHAQSPKEENWKAGVLVDWSDIASPVSYGWKLTRYGKRDAKFVLKK